MNIEQQLLALGYKRGQLCGTWWRGAYVISTAQLARELGLYNQELKPCIASY
jgi:hypothetical protein